MNAEGSIRWVCSAAYSDRVFRLADDGQRWRWWLLQSFVDRRSFPGLLATKGLEPIPDLQVVGAIFRGQWEDRLSAAVEQWEADKAKMLEVGLVEQLEVLGRRYLYSRDFHVYQDLNKPEKRYHIGHRFRLAYEKLPDSGARERFVRLVGLFRPRFVYVLRSGTDVTGDAAFWEKESLPLAEMDVIYVPPGQDLLLSGADGEQQGILLEIYERSRGPMPQTRRFTETLKRHALARMREHKKDLKEYLRDFEEAVRRAAKSPFLTGQGESGWRASFEWFVKSPDNVYKVLNGMYDGPAVREAQRPAPSPAKQLDSQTRRTRRCSPRPSA